jgi:hypothetical protein
VSNVDLVTINTAEIRLAPRLLAAQLADQQQRNYDGCKGAEGQAFGAEVIGHASQ